MREVLLMNYDWKFYDGDVEDRSYDCTHSNVSLNPSWLKSGNNGVSKWGFPDGEWVDVDLPHDFVCERGEFSKEITASQGSLVKGIAWYRKSFELKADDKDRTIHIEFDGIFRNFEVWLNGHLLGTELSGYKSGSFCIDDVCHYEEVNVLAIRVDAMDYEGWWYEGGGIYRNIRLVKTTKVFVPTWGTFVRTEVNDDYNQAEALCQTRVKNESQEDKHLSVVSNVIDSNGKTVTSSKVEIEIAAYSELTIEDSITMTKIHLWDFEDPYLYTLETVIQEGDQIHDTYETSFGIRVVDFNSEEGFFINGRNVKLKGVCCHEDHAGVGVALPDQLHEYRIKLLKEMGCNAYRSSHNPPTPAILDACDKYGLVFMDETRIMDTCQEYTEQLETLIRRDRNHPCVILWSLGNEEMNIHGTDIGIRIYKRLIRIAKSLDPSRKTIYAMNSNWFDISSFNEENGFKVEVGGLNYNLLRKFEGYDWIHEKYPDMILLGTENASTLSTRGLYEMEAHIPEVDGDSQAAHECIFESPERGNFVSGYGEVYPPWGSTPMETWTTVESRPFVAGVFIWTGFDYRGETIPYKWPCVVSHFGIMDLCGFPKDIYYYYKAWWTKEDTLHIFPHWNWEGKEGQPVEVRVFTNMDRVELFLNGSSQGMMAITMESKAAMMIPYEAGELRAVGYRNDKIVMEKTIETTKKPSNIELIPSVSEMTANRKDICIINIKALDEAGRFVQTANDLLSFKVTGPGKIIGTGNGNPMSHEHDKKPERKLFHGLCQVIIQSTFESGQVSLEVSGQGYEVQTLNLNSIKPKQLSYVKVVTKDQSKAEVIGRRDAADGLL